MQIYANKSDFFTTAQCIRISIISLKATALVTINALDNNYDKDYPATIVQRKKLNNQV